MKVYRLLAALCASCVFILAAAAQKPAALGLPPLATPPAAQVALGKKLFFDRRLSINGTLSCAMCHVPEQAFTVNEIRTAVGMEGVSLRRSAPTLLNVAYATSMFHDGRAKTLEDQALQPLLEDDEMANPDIETVMRRINAMKEYREPYKKAFGNTRATPERTARALAAYERTLIAANSPFDRWHYGKDADAMPAKAQRGFTLFVKNGCSSCHTLGEKDALFSDGQFHNTGVQARTEALNKQSVTYTLVPGLQSTMDPKTLASVGVPDQDDLGRYEVTKQHRDLRAFKTPTLRNVGVTGPYMHDGSLTTLGDVLDFYAAGGIPSDKAQDPLIKPFAMTAQDREAMLAFLDALTSSDARTFPR